MERVSLALLGDFMVKLEDGRTPVLPLKKAQALLAYLAVPAGTRHPRDKIAALLWGDMREPQARKGMRQALFVLRRALGALGETGVIRSEGKTLSLDAALLSSDVAEFEACANRDTTESLERAAILYRGDFLEGLSLQEPPFMEWLLAERLRIRELALGALTRLVLRQREAGARGAAVQTAQRLLALEPQQEAVHRALMRLHAELGNRAAALLQYQLCVGVLQRELRAEPEAETQSLYREIVQRKPPSRPEAGAPPPAEVPRAPADRAPAFRPARSDPPLVGREPELGRLRDVLRSACAGQLEMVALIGEAGIGKSRLASEIAVEMERAGGRVFVGRCHDSERVLPFGPWIDAFRDGGLAAQQELLSALDPVPRAELARLLPEIAEGSARLPTSDAVQLFEGIAQVLERAAADRPLLLLLEDLQWADEMSLRLLAFVARRLRTSRTLGLLTARAEDVPDSALLRRTLDELDDAAHLTRCALGPLARDESLALARALVPAPEAARLAEQLWRASEGNPFMIVETLRALAGMPAGRGGGDAAAPLPLPQRVRALIRARLERLGERARRLAAVAAVIGRPFDWTLLERAGHLGESDTAAGLEELVRHLIVRGRDEVFEFTHDRVREVVYAELLAPSRGLLHRQVAEALEQVEEREIDRHCLALGIHYLEGQVWHKAALYLPRAARQANNRFAERDAVACYEQALSALAQLPDSPETRQQDAEIRLALAHTLHALGEFARGVTYLRQTEQAALASGDQRRLAAIYGNMAYHLGWNGDYAGAIEAGLRALTIAEARGQADVAIWSSFALARVYHARGDYRHAIERMRQVMEAVRERPDSRYGRNGLLAAAACPSWLGFCLASTGDFGEALAWADMGARVAEARGGPREQVLAGYCAAGIHLAHGDSARAIPILEKTMSLCESRPLFRSRVIASLGRAWTLAGEVDAALPLLERAVAEVEVIRLPLAHPTILIWMAAAQLDAGNLERAEECAATALALSRKYGARGDEAWALHALGTIAERRESPGSEAALEKFRLALLLAEELHMAPLRALYHVTAGARAGRPAS